MSNRDDQTELSISDSDLAIEVERLRDKYRDLLDPPPWIMQSTLVLVDFKLKRVEQLAPEVQAEIDAMTLFFSNLEASEARSRVGKGEFLGKGKEGFSEDQS